MSTTTQNRWQDTYDGGDDALNVVALSELFPEVQRRITEMQELANDLPDQMQAQSFGVMSDEDHEELRLALCHMLANLNRARIHLADPTGC